VGEAIEVVSGEEEHVRGRELRERGRDLGAPLGLLGARGRVVAREAAGELALRALGGAVAADARADLAVSAARGDHGDELREARLAAERAQVGGVVLRERREGVGDELLLEGRVARPPAPAERAPHGGERRARVAGDELLPGGVVARLAAPEERLLVRLGHGGARDYAPSMIAS